MFEIVSIFVIVLQIVLIGYLVLGRKVDKDSRALDSSESQAISLRLRDLDSQITSVVATQEKTDEKISVLPVTILRTIQGSVNHTTGKLGELVQFIELQRAYDRLIPVGSIVDFIGVKFSTEETPGALTFIDIKTGKRAVLSKDQKALRSIIESQNIEFHTVKVEVT